eukprot:m.171642 g.171642  ORF g.171642 m.171642 type:complete len:1174 (-) comp16707_c0_seq3:41-3562(-)
MSSDDELGSTEPSKQQGGDYPVAGLTILQLKQRRWLARPSIHDDLQLCRVQTIKQQTTKQAIVRFESGGLKKVPLSSLQPAPTSPPATSFDTFLDRASSEPSPKRSPSQSQWIATQTNLNDSSHSQSQDAQAPVQESTFVRPVAPAPQTVQLQQRSSTKRNPREEHARRMDYLMKQSSQVDDIYTPPTADQAPSRSVSRPSSASSHRGSSARAKLLASDDEEADVISQRPGMVRKLSKRRRQQVRSTGSDTPVPPQRGKSGDEQPTDPSPAKIAQSELDNESCGSTDSESPVALPTTPHRLRNQLSATEQLKRVDKHTRPQFDCTPAESEPLPLWPGLPGREVDFSQARSPSDVAQVDGETPWPWMHLQRVAVAVPAAINRYLRSYQREGVSVMAQSLRQGQGHLLADDMGLGKTVQVIALMAALFGKTGSSEEDAGKSWASRLHRGTVLIVCPASVLYNWAHELTVWGFFEVGTYHGIHKEEAAQALEDDRLDVVLTTYGTLVKTPSLQRYRWMLVVLDECHRIKSGTSQTAKACDALVTRHRLGLSGTIFQNEFKEMWTVLHWARPGCLGSIKEFKAKFQNPIVQGHRASATVDEIKIGMEASRELLRRVAPMMLRRTKAELADQLPNKSERVYFCKLTDYQLACYRRYLTSDDIDIIRRRNEPCDCNSGNLRKKCCYQFIVGHKTGLLCTCNTGKACRKCHCSDEDKQRENVPGCTPWYYLVFPVMSTLRQLSNHPAMLIPRQLDDPDVKRKKENQCRRVFDKEDRWVQLIRRNGYEACADVKRCGKMAAAQTLIGRWLKQRDAVIVFSYSTRLLDLVEDMLRRGGLDLLRIDGAVSPKKRQTIVEAFNRGESRVILVSTKAGGEGINLTAANRVLILDPCWNPSHDRQAQDRAYRIGQQRDVEVVRLVTLGSMEELVYARQVYKLQLASIAMEGRGDQKRLFDAVQGGENGELFGLDNILAEPEPRSMIQAVLERNSDLSPTDRAALQAVAGQKDADGFVKCAYQPETVASAVTGLQPMEAGLDDDDPQLDIDGDTAHEYEVTGLLKAEGADIEMTRGDDGIVKQKPSRGALSLGQVFTISTTVLLGDDERQAGFVKPSLPMMSSSTNVTVASDSKESAGQLPLRHRLQLLRTWRRWLIANRLRPSQERFTAFVAMVVTAPEMILKDVL